MMPKVSLYEFLYNCNNFSTIEFPSTFNTSSVTDMRSIFKGCHRLTSLALSTFSTSNVTNMSEIFVDVVDLHHSIYPNLIQAML